jgi:hypothetical protein
MRSASWAWSSPPAVSRPRRNEPADLWRNNVTEGVFREAGQQGLQPPEQEEDSG